MDNKVKILVLFYSFTGSTAKLAKYIAEGAREIDEVEVAVKQVPELLPGEFFDSKPELKIPLTIKPSLPTFILSRYSSGFLTSITLGALNILTSIVISCISFLLSASSSLRRSM